MVIVGFLRPQNLQFVVQMFPCHISCLYTSESSMIRKQGEALFFSHLHKSNMSANIYIIHFNRNVKNERRTQDKAAHFQHNLTKLNVATNRLYR